MLPLAILVSIIAFPVILTFLLRSPAAIVFLALCGGIVFFEFSGADAEIMLSAAWPQVGPGFKQALNIILIATPPLAVAVFQRKKAKGIKLIIGLFPALSVGALLALSVVPHISVLTRQTIEVTWLWQNLVHFGGLFVVTGIFFSVMLLKPAKSKDEHHKKHGSKHS